MSVERLKIVRESIRSKLMESVAIWQNDIVQREEQLRVQKKILDSAEAKTDRSENAVYQTAVDNIRLLDIEIKNLTDKVDAFSSFMAKEYTPYDRIVIGSTVVISIKGENSIFECYIVPRSLGSAKIGAISESSSVGAALLGRHTGDIVTVTTIQGNISYCVEEVY